MKFTEDPLWFKDAIIYELHIKAFKDSNGDGMGDFKGLIQKLDYLSDLGITAIWVLPFYPSPLKDDGYDIADYYTINPAYGTLEDFKELIKEVHSRGMKLITELVINHTSDQHPWFQRARLAPKGSVERDYYVWSDDPSKYKDVRIIFQDFETSNWAWDDVAGQYYWHRFFSHQPDLNFDNPAVREEIFKIIDYWAGMGVDGFRLDAIPYLFEREGTNGENLPETHNYLKELRKYLDSKYPGRIFLAEANMWPEVAAAYLGDGDECHMNFHFPLMPRMFMSIQMEDRYPITDIFYQTPEIPDNTQWAIFLRNHDELTLEMVTDEERDYMYKVYAKDPKARINLGIRHRLAPLMENNIRKIELMNLLLFSLEGTPVIYYGDEIGMGDNFYLGDRDGVRTPMQWTADRNAGFSDANPQRLYLPVILDPEYKYESVNVENQKSNPSSLFWFMKRIIQFRKKYKALSRGNLKFIYVDNPKILAYIREYEEEKILVVINLSRFSQPAEMQLQEYAGFDAIEIISRIHFPAIPQSGNYFLSLSPHSAYFFELNQVEVKQLELKNLPVINIASWEDLISQDNRLLLEQEIITPYFLRSEWFLRKGRPLRNLHIAKAIPVKYENREFYLFLIELNFETGLPNLFFLPVVFLTNHADHQQRELYPESVLADAEYNQVKGRLYDALFSSELHSFFLEKFLGESEVLSATEKIKFFKQKNLEASKPEFTGHSRVLNSENHVSIGFDSTYFLKIYRHVDVDINSEVELNTYLQDRDFEHIPELLGNFKWESYNGTVTLGIFQELVEFHGDGYSYMLERLNNYYERISSRTVYPELTTENEFLNKVDDAVLSEEVQEFIGTTVSVGIDLIAKATASLHLNLAAASKTDMQPEPFSLHYQRSLYSGMVSLLRHCNGLLRRKMESLTPEAASIASMILSQEQDILNILKRIYDHKIEVVKTRIHGNLELKQFYFTGKDVVIANFGGDPTKSYSERRFKRSVLRDVAGVIRSIYYAGYEGLVFKFGEKKEDQEKLIPFADSWIQHITGMFLHEYFNEVGDSNILPPTEEELDIMLRNYLIEKALLGLIEKLRVDPEKAIIPLSLLSKAININKE